MGSTNNDRHQFKPLLVEIEDRAVNPLGRVLLWIIIIIIIFGSLWLYFAKIDVVVSASGTVIPNGQIKILQPMQKGVVSDILVKEGDLVKKNQPLIIIDRSVTKSNLESKKKNLEITDLEIKRISALINNKNFIIPEKFKNTVIANTQMTYYQSIKSAHENLLKKLQSQINSVKEKIIIASIEEDKAKVLKNNAKKRLQKLKEVQDIISGKEYEDALDKYLNLQKQYLEKIHEISKLKAELDELNEENEREQKEFRNKLFEELLKKRKLARDLKVQIKDINFKNKKLIIRSPVEGYVGNLMIHTLGGVVTPAQKLISIVPVNAPLIISAKISNKDIGFVKKNMESIVKIDTYDFQKYGYLNGKVVYISKDALEDKKLGPVYKVYIHPKKNYLLYNGKKLYIFPGMSCRVEIKTGKRRVIEFFIYPLIKYFNESVSVR